MTTSFGPSGAPSLAGPAGGSQNFGYPMDYDRIVRKEASLGFIRQLAPPEDHLWPKLIPMMDVPTDDFVFDYIEPDITSGLASARAQDAESELVQHDFWAGGQGRASIMDWANKDTYSDTAVVHYRDAQAIAQAMNASGAQLPTTVAQNVNHLPTKIARHARQRVQRFHNRFEEIFTKSLVNSEYTYNDGRMGFTIPWGRPAGQTDQTPESGTYAADTHDPVNDFLAVGQYMFDTHGITIDRVIGSRKALSSFYKSSKFRLLTGFAPGAGVGESDMNYLVKGWGPRAAMEFVAEQTGITPIVHDSVYRTRNADGTVTATRYLPEDTLIFLPAASSISEIDSTGLGFGRVCTAPHIEGNMQSGFYEWEQLQRDPWQLTVGTGIKAFPVLPYMHFTYTLKLTL